MKKFSNSFIITIVSFLMLCIVSKSAVAQTGIHIQQYTNSAYVYNQDSVYMPVSFSNGFSHMVLVNPETKEWKYLNTVNYNKYLGPFVMKNPMEGVMIYSSQQKVYKTTDGWQTLTEVPSVANGYGLSQVAVTDAGYIGFESSLEDLYFSADGLTWTLAFDGSTSLNILKAKDNKVILYTGAQSGNYVSTDGGQTFSIVPFGGSFSGSFIDFEMLAEDTLIVATTSHLYKSVDGGQTWTERTVPATLQTVTIKDTSEMFISTQSGNYYTSDGGATWQTKDNTAAGKGDFIDDKLYIWPDYKSTDNGTTWSYMFPKILSNSTIFDIYFKENIGLIGKEDGKINLSFDGGRSFGFDITLPTSEDIMAVKILNNGDFIVGDRMSQIFYSSDNGQTWSQRFSNTTTFNAVKFSNSDNDSIIVETRLGQPVVSSDFGATFNFITAGGGSHSQTVTPNGKIIDAGGWFDYTTFQYKGLEISELTPSGNKTILDTVLIASNAATESIIDIAMASNTVGYAITYNSTTSTNNIYKTTNGWMGGTTLKGSVAPYSAVKLHVLSEDTLMLTSTTSTLYYYSYDGGANWTQATLGVFTEYPSIYTSIKEAFFFDANNYIFGLNDYGLYVNNKGSDNTPTGIYEFAGSKSNVRELIAYPNPASDNINLEYTGDADVQICDYTGRVVYKKSKMDAGESINVSDFTAGLYIITVQNGSDNFVGKFIKQ